MTAIALKQTEVPLQRVADLICCGMEGGINYWGGFDSCREPAEYSFLSNPDLNDGKPFKHIDPALNEGGAVILFLENPEDNEDNKPLELTLDTIKTGLEIMGEKYPHQMANFLGDNEDAETGDVFIQCCILGEAIYG